MFKPSAHGRLLSLEDEDFCLKHSKDRILLYVPAKTKIFVFQRQSSKSNMFNFRRRSLKDKDKSRPCADQKDKNLSKTD